MGALYGYLYAEPSFVQGFASVIDLGDTLTEYNQSITPEQADSLAIGADWRAVGLDLIRAIEHFKTLLSAEH